MTPRETNLQNFDVSFHILNQLVFFQRLIQIRPPFLKKLTYTKPPQSLNIVFAVLNPTAWGLTLRRPLRKKLRMRWYFDVSEVKESSFLKSDLTDLPSDF